MKKNFTNSKSSEIDGYQINLHFSGIFGFGSSITISYVTMSSSGHGFITTMGHGGGLDLGASFSMGPIISTDGTAVEREEILGTGYSLSGGDIIYGGVGTNSNLDYINPTIGIGAEAGGSMQITNASELIWWRP